MAIIETEKKIVIYDKCQVGQFNSVTELPSPIQKYLAKTLPKEIALGQFFKYIIWLKTFLTC